MREADLFLLFPRGLAVLGTRYMVSGAVAAMIYGPPRFTFGIDLIAVLDLTQIARLSEVFPEAEFDCPPIEAIAEEAAREEHGHFNIIHHETGFKADMYLVGRDPLHAWALPRARRLDVGGEPLVVAPPEYVIVRKLEFYREGGSEKHLRDIRAMLETSPDAIDRPELDRLIGERRLQDEWKKAQYTAR